jgi:plasmid stabilization system protein ParE
VNYNVIVTPTADAEAMDAFRWYAERSLDAGEKWYAGLEHTMNSLAVTPTPCPVSQDDSEALGCEVRTLLYGKRRSVFRILFSISGDAVTVLRIVHSAQGPIKS